MKRALVVAALLLVVAAATPWAIGWRTEQLVRERVAQVDADPAAQARMRIDSYSRGWHRSAAEISIVDRAGAPLVRFTAAIRHWPFARGGPADWVAVPEFGSAVHDALGPWGTKLPEVTTYTQLSWRGDVHARIESLPFKRRVPEVAGGTLEVAPLAGTVDWRRDGALAYDLAMPVFRAERLRGGRAGAADIVEFKDVEIKGEGSLGAAERRWNQQGSLVAAAVTVTEAGTTTFSAATPRWTYSTRDEGEFVDVQLAFAVASVHARHALQDLTDASIEFSFDARHLAKGPFGRMLDAHAAPAAPESAAAVPGRGSRAPLAETAYDLLRGSPAGDVRLLMKAREGSVDVKLAWAVDGQGLERRSGAAELLQRVDATLDIRASTALVLVSIREAATAAAAAAGALAPPGRPAHLVELPDAPALDPDAGARRQLNALATQGLIRLDGEDVATTIVWRKSGLTINGQDMSLLRELARGLAGR